MSHCKQKRIKKKINSGCFGTVKKDFSQCNSVKVHFCSYFHRESGGADICKQLIKGVSTSTFGANSGSGNRACSCAHIFTEIKMYKEEPRVHIAL